MKAKVSKQSRWGGLRQGAGRPKSDRKSRYTKCTRIDPKWDRLILAEQGKTFADKLDQALKRSYGKNAV